VKGSTNWSLSGEQQQDNELSLSRNAVVAAETRAILDLNHDFMLKQMTGTKLEMKGLLAPASKDATPPAASRPTAGRNSDRGPVRPQQLTRRPGMAHAGQPWQKRMRPGPQA
jgi:hypothetical protein